MKGNDLLASFGAAPLRVLLAASLLYPSVAQADDKATCIAAASRGQTLRDAHQLMEARAQFRVCARRECPAIVQTDCGGWLDAVERALPTVVFSAKDTSGRDVFDVSVSADGELVAKNLDGSAVPMNPGVHVFRFERAGTSVATEQVIVREGAKAQSVAIVLSEGSAAAATIAATPANAEAPGGSTPPRGGAQRVVGFALGGVGVAGMGVGAALALIAKSKDSAAANESGLARQTDSRSAVSQGNVATVIFGVGAGLAAAGVVVWLTAPSGTTAVGVDGRAILLRMRF